MNKGSGITRFTFCDSIKVQPFCEDPLQRALSKDIVENCNICLLRDNSIQFYVFYRKGHQVSKSVTDNVKAEASVVLETVSFVHLLSTRKVASKMN